MKWWNIKTHEKPNSQLGFYKIVLKVGYRVLMGSNK